MDEFNALKEAWETKHQTTLWINTDICVAWRAHHPNCHGCKHYTDCKAYVTILQKEATRHNNGEGDQNEFGST